MVNTSILGGIERPIKVETILTQFGECTMSIIFVIFITLLLALCSITPLSVTDEMQDIVRLER